MGLSLKSKVGNYEESKSTMKTENQVADATISSLNLSPLTEDDYRSFINLKAETDSTRIFKNGSPKNANIVFANIFRRSNVIRLYASCMNGDIGDALPDYHSGLMKFLSKDDSKITIVLDNLADKKSNSLKYLLDYRLVRPQKVKIHIASAGFKTAVQAYEVNESNDLHFITGDKKRFRLEHNNANHTAYFSFNNNDITETLNNVFDAHVNTCDVI